MNAQDVFFIFFGIFWYSVIYSCNRYRPFDTHRLLRAPQESGSSARQTWARLAVALLLLDLVPVLGIWFLGTHVVAAGRSFWAIASAGFAALSVLSMTRIFHGVLVAEPWWRAFYSEAEHQRILKRWRPDPGDQPNSRQDHLLPGLASSRSLSDSLSWPGRLPS